jgi:hypothetical protein
MMAKTTSAKEFAIIGRRASPIGWHTPMMANWLQITERRLVDRHRSKCAIIKVWRSSNDGDLDLTVSRVSLLLYSSLRSPCVPCTKPCGPSTALCFAAVQYRIITAVFFNYLVASSSFYS